jgi:hypothetical protein
MITSKLVATDIEFGSLDQEEAAKVCRKSRAICSSHLCTARSKVKGEKRASEVEGVVKPQAKGDWCDDCGSALFWQKHRG